MKDFIYKKLIVILILLQPVIDMITSYMVMSNIDFSIGIIIKLFIMLLAFIYLVFFDKEHQRFNYLFLAILLIFCSLNIFNNMFVIKLRLFTYFNYLIKYVYHLIMLLFFIRWYKNYGIKLYNLRIPLLIIIVTYFIAYFTNTAYLSYGGDSPNLGYSGWYSSANELGNLLCLLFPVALYNAFHNKDGIFLDKILFILCGICMLMIGTKVGLLGFFGVLVGYIFLRLFFIKRSRLDFRWLFTLFFVAIVAVGYKELPAIKNIDLSYDYYNSLNGVLFNGRDVYFKEMTKKRKDIDLYGRLIGKSYIYGKTSDILIIEQDFYDIYFMYGIVGLGLFIFLYAKVYYMFFKKMFLYLKKPKLFSKKYFAVIVAVTLELCVAFIAGHSLLSPSVSTYLTLLVAMSLTIDIKENKERKKIILVSKHSNFANKINLEKYDVHYLIMDDAILNEKMAFYPYYSNCKFIHLKVIRNLLFNRFMLFNLRRNQKYDYVLGDNSLPKIERYFLRIANGKKVVVGKKTDKYFKEKISIREINSL